MTVDGTATGKQLLTVDIFYYCLYRVATINVQK